MLSSRKMQPSDLADVVSIEREANQFPWSLKNFEDCLKANHKSWVFFDDSNAILGFTIVQKVVDEAHILNICIKPSVQGQGHGRDLLNYIIDYANKISSVLIVLEVRSSNKRAQNLYLQAGFNEMSVRKNYYPAAEGREDAVLMGLDLGLLSLFSE
ncbi:ribosomal protein S18-alanine N-acetyltransferase [Pseudomonadota bacterium]|nr:ribosomal protein S18-alanine N-acetyltransferase [Pseudomonadota bacterium]